MCVLRDVYIILTGYFEWDFYFQNPSIKLCLSCVSVFLSLYFSLHVSRIWICWLSFLHPSSSLHPPPLHSVHPVLHSMPVFGWCPFSTRALVFSAGSQSLLWTKVLSPLRIPCVGRQTASLDVVGYELLAVIFVRPGSFLWCWYRRGFAGLGGLRSQKRGSMWMRVRVCQSESE